MPRSSAHLLGRLRRRGALPATDEEWEQVVLLEPRLASYDPGLVSDGGGLPFAPAALDGPDGRLASDDPAVGALVARLARQKASQNQSGAPSLEGWRMLARSEREVLFGHGVPPQLVTLAMRRGRRGETWSSVVVTTGKPLRSVRDGVRASGWRLDPAREPTPGDTALRILVTEQSRSGGERADGRLLAPDLHDGSDELVLTMYVTPRPGVQQPASAILETPARVRLPQPVAGRQVSDGAIYEWE